MDPDWLCFHPNPSKPRFRLPPGAVDAHCHVFGPASTFPFAPQRKYTPCDASKDQLFALRDVLGVDRNVVVQATCHGNDNRALVDALVHSGGKARGVASVARDISDAELRALHEAGVRGTRFNFVKRLVDFTPREVLAEIAQRIAPLGWHVVVYFEAQDLPQLWDFFTSLPTTVVVDHMGRPDVTKPVDGPEFATFVRLLDEHPNIWSKVSCPERLSKIRPAWLRRRRPVRAAHRRALPRPRALGHRLAASQPQGPHARRRHAGRLRAAHRDHARAAAQAPGRQSDAPLLAGSGSATVKSYNDAFKDIPGTTVFDATQSRLGYHLNMFCMSLMHAENRAAFKADERAYLERYPMTTEQRQAVLDRDYNRMIALGGNIYFLAKIGATDGFSFQNLASKMTGVSEEDYRAMMIAGGRPAQGNRSRSDPTR